VHKLYAQIMCINCVHKFSDSLKKCNRLHEKENFSAKFFERLTLLLTLSLIQEGSRNFNSELRSLSLGYAVEEAMDLS
jgi:hypothetical protein